MKKLIVLVLFVVLVAPPYALAIRDFSESSGEQTASAQIYSGECYVSKIWVITDGTNDAKVIIYDSKTGSGKVVGEITVNGGSQFGGVANPYPVHHNNGIYVTVSGSGASYIVEYIPLF